MEEAKDPERTLWEVFMKFLEEREQRFSTRKSYTVILCRCVPEWLHQPITNITSEMVADKHKELSVHGKRQADLTCAILRAVINFAIGNYKTEEDQPVYTRQPVDVLSVRKAWNPKARRTSRLDPDDIPAWFRATMALKPEQETARDLLIFLYFTGLRKMEAGKLKWEQVDLVKRYVTILSPKNGNENFLLPLSSTPLSLLQHRKEKSNSPFVFPSALFLDQHISEYDETYLQVSKESQVSFTPHALRRTFTSTAIDLKIHTYTVKALVNHKSSDVTFNNYYAPSLNHLRNEMQKVDDELVLSIHGQSQFQSRALTA